ncbi:MFS transporter [Pseudoalteromonas shioyasakiensis]|uniref:MFS transporter n=1 Tax=Pseudoalteromonas shioyasakiensis TaxID=1190813 RepID=UPI001EFEBFF3|nr:MFS transporter [Pseudoalteromonas shioyasakiensis]MCG9736396.1 MFS transporter [Pseudoalteromonas shioyasakiensis]
MKTISKTNRLSLMIVLSFAAFVSVMNSSMMNVAIPAIIKDYAIPTSFASWVITSYVTVFALGTAIYGKALDLFKLKPIFIIAISIFGIGCLMCSFSPSYWFLVVGRSVQAIGSSAIPALAFGAVAKFFPLERRGISFGVISAAIGLGGACGPVIGGIVVSTLGWHSLFIGTTCLLAILAACHRLLPDEENTPSEKGRIQELDLLGVLLFGTAIICILLSISFLQLESISNFYSLISISFGLFLFINLVSHLKKSSHPFIDIKLLNNSKFAKGSFTAFVGQAIYLGGLLFVLPLAMSDQYGINEDKIGLILAPGALAVACISPLAGKLTDKYGPVAILFSGLLIFMFSMFFMSIYSFNHNLFSISLTVVIAAIGFAFIMSASAVIASISTTENNGGTSMGVYQLILFMGAGIGACIFGGLIEFLHSHVDEKGLVFGIFSINVYQIIFALSCLIVACPFLILVKELRAPKITAVLDEH